MPVLTKERLNYLQKELRERYFVLSDAITSRELKNSREGAGGTRHWVEPRNMSATVADGLHIRMVVEDFKNVLAEIKKLK